VTYQSGNGGVNLAALIALTTSSRLRNFVALTTSSRLRNPLRERGQSGVALSAGAARIPNTSTADFELLLALSVDSLWFGHSRKPTAVFIYT
jgi:hypothetical protein